MHTGKGQFNGPIVKFTILCVLISGGCPKDAPLASCFEDPCSVETCKEHPDAEC